MHRDTMITTTAGLNRQSPPMRLFEKAKRLGVWNPSELNFGRDRADWLSLTSGEQTLLLHLTALFQAGEEAVTLDLLPLIMTIANEGRLEEELYLTTFLFEEAKHTDFFTRFLEEVAQHQGDMAHFHTPSYRMLFYKALPEALQALRHDSSPTAQVRAAVTYNMIVEGVLAETGYFAYHKILDENNLMPGVRQGIQLLKQDESRHIAYGIYLLSRLMAVQPELFDVAQETMNQLLPVGFGIISDIFSQYDPMPFGLQQSDFSDYALNQFQKRVARIQQSRGVALADVQEATQQIIDANDG